MKTQGTVFVGLSGGVDSSVAAWRLQQAGYDVVGVFIKVWQPDFLQCNWEQERLDAMRVAAHLKIPFLTCDAEDAYRREVGEFFIQEYLAGRTPNPDVMCNQHVKFGAFLQFAEAHGADYIATGHYAQKITSGSIHTLRRGIDTNKDQSYFLWTLTQTQLKRVLLPVGESTKSVIRATAARAGLPVAEKKDSQGVCFLGHIDIPEFLSHFVTLTEGAVCDEAGTVIGTHKGALVYTIGQRHGFEITSTETSRLPHYIIAKDLSKNTITVSTKKPQLATQAHISLQNVNWIYQEPAVGAKLQAQFRYRQTPCAVEYISSNTVMAIDTVDTPAVGQSCVLYEGEECLGGGIIV